MGNKHSLVTRERVDMQSEPEGICESEFPVPFSASHKKISRYGFEKKFTSE